MMEFDVPSDLDDPSPHRIPFRAGPEASFEDDLDADLEESLGEFPLQPLDRRSHLDVIEPTSEAEDPFVRGEPHEPLIGLQSLRERRLPGTRKATDHVQGGHASTLPRTG